MPSPNGSHLSMLTGDVPTFAGCFRNAAAVAAAAAEIGPVVGVIAAGEVWADGLLPSRPCVVCRSAIEPLADQILTLDRGNGGVGSRPFRNGIHQELLGAMGEDVAQNGHLIFSLIGDGGRVVAAIENSALPAQ